MGDGNISNSYGDKGGGQTMAAKAMVTAIKMRDGGGNDVAGNKEGDGESGKSDDDGNK